MMAVAVVDDVLALHLEGRQQVSDQGDYPRGTHGSADGHAIKKFIRYLCFDILLSQVRVGL
jgi:hypothetical protein